MEIISYVFGKADGVDIHESRHSHEFWQCDMYESDRGVKAGIGKAWFELKNGYILLLPPETEHEVRVFSARRYHSLKFRCTGGVFGKIAACRLLYSSAKDIFRNIFDGVSISDVLSKQIKEHYLSLLLLRLAGIPGRGAAFSGRDGRDPRVEKAVAIIRKAEDDGIKITLRRLAATCGMSLNHFVRVFKKETGTTPMHYRTKVKIERASEFLLYSDMKIGQIADSLNFRNIYSFSRAFRNETGKSPSAWRRTEIDKHKKSSRPISDLKDY